LKYFLIVVVLAAVATTTATIPAFAADVGVSISIGQPGFYGQLDIGDFPPPRLIYRQPMIIERERMDRPPIYLRAPPGHIKHWRDHCREYNACGERVYFVQDDWYNREYVPRYQRRHENWKKDIRSEHGDRDNDKRHGNHDNGPDDHGRNDYHDKHHNGREH